MENCQKMCQMICTITQAMHEQVEEGIHQIDTHQFGEVADILKDIAQAYESCAKAEYYNHVVEAMENGDKTYTDGVAILRTVWANADTVQKKAMKEQVSNLLKDMTV